MEDILNFFALLKDLFFFAGYISSGRTFPKQLSALRERELVEKFIGGDEQSRQLLIEHNLRLVAHIVKKYENSRDDSEDLISIGTIGLIKGVNTFNPEKANSLAAYVSRCIENELLMHFRSGKKRNLEVSLGDAVGEDREGNKISLVEIISGDDLQTDEQVMINIQIEKLNAILPKCLSGREQVVLELRYGLNGAKMLPQREIASKLGISRSYISRIEKRALAKLYKEMNK